MFCICSEREINLMLERLDIISENALDLISIEENQEVLVPIKDLIPDAIIAMVPNRRRFASETLYLRERAALQLREASRQLYPLRLKVFDAYRPLEYQEKLFDDCLNRLRISNPSWSEDRIRFEAFTYIFPPNRDTRRPPAHATGGAIDLTLVDPDGSEINMGSAYIDFNSSSMYTNMSGLAPDVRNNRVILLKALAQVGFVNFPGEWWHYSLGDREWAAYRGFSSCPYGRIDDPYQGRLS